MLVFQFFDVVDYGDNFTDCVEDRRDVDYDDLSLPFFDDWVRRYWDEVFCDFGCRMSRRIRGVYWDWGCRGDACKAKDGGYDCWCKTHCVVAPGIRVERSSSSSVWHRPFLAILSKGLFLKVLHGEHSARRSFNGRSTGVVKPGGCCLYCSHFRACEAAAGEQGKPT